MNPLIRIKLKSSIWIDWRECWRNQMLGWIEGSSFRKNSLKIVFKIIIKYIWFNILTKVDGSGRRRKFLILILRNTYWELYNKWTSGFH